ncbi:MAG: ATP-binding protein, partial [Acidimicrobiia bacterium]
LAGGVAHDLNNTLSPILLASDMLLDMLSEAELGLDADADPAELVATIGSSARRGADLVAQLLSFARGVDGERVPVDVGELLRSAERIVRETFPKNITVSVHVAPVLEAVVGDRTQLQQVLLNLAVNARDAMPDGGTISMSASNVELDGQYLVTTDGVGPGRYVVIEVEDDGHGMAADVLDHVFEPFFTTKDPGAGTGLGLSMSAGIVQSHGGFVRAYSEVGSGSRFRVYLPTAARRQAEPAADDSGAPSRRGAGETVLVVDDEDSLRAMTRRTLESAGYLVVEAGNGAEAVAVFAREQERVAVVLIDMMMPVMDGASAIHALQSLDPEVRIVAASGLHGNGQTARASNAGVQHFLPKPYTSSSLLDTIAAALAD